jgi:DNA-binding transcriptional regulator GbsR (MarR family)
MKTLSPVAKKFILHWGEMGTRWGVNRTVAQIHALLYISSKPMHDEEIGEALSVARSNVSNSLRELQNWGIVRKVHVFGDTRDHFESMKDVWEMFQVILQERKRREIDPTLALLRESVAELEKGGSADAYAKGRLQEMLDFLETTTAWYAEMRRLPPSVLKKFLRLGGKVSEMLGS